MELDPAVRPENIQRYFTNPTATDSHVWFLHPKKTIITNDTKFRPDRIPTGLTDAELIQIVKDFS